VSSSVTESVEKQSPWRGPLDAFTDTISLDQTVTFTRYARLVLPSDGSVFWVRAELLSASALLNAFRLNIVALDGIVRGVPAPVLVARGSLHYATETRQEEQAVFARNSVIFTSEQPVQDLNDVSPELLWLAEFEDIRFAFSARQPFYHQAGLWHYRGQALYSTMQTQVVDDLATFDAYEPVVSNSLPIWLSLQAATPFPNLGGCGVPLYPSFAVPDNLPPPFVSVHVEPAATRSFQAAPWLSQKGYHRELSADRVRLTSYGLRNANALTFFDYVQRFSVTTGLFGVMNVMAVRDEKQTQPELLILAQRKTIDVEVSYHQRAATRVAKQLIEQAFLAASIAPPTFADVVPPEV
jgi:hypothetical protein